MKTTSRNIINGGAFLIKDTEAETVFIPESFSEEQCMIRDMCYDFIKTEVRPVLNEIDMQKPGLMESLLDKSGRQGLLGAAFPEKYGGLDKDFITATLINEALGSGHSYSVAMAAHTGIGSLPLLYFGTEPLKEKYMPGLASGSIKASYALSEPNSGSDALSVQTTARLTDDKKYYILNGQKCWITNSAFADLFTVFAKIDGTDFTAFLIEKEAPGMSLGEEEHKMGIKGSSTRQVFFEDCKIPAGNLLGEQGKGHKIAFNILNIGRLKLCAAALGGAKRTTTISTLYAIERQQFKQPIIDFGAIQHKLAEQAVRIFTTESALYRTASNIDAIEKKLSEAGKPFQEAAMQSAEEYAIECAILKVAGSEALDYVVDEAVQIHGGNGFIDEYEVSRAYRDSRINRIFEGTNEINRLLIPGMMLKRAAKGRLDIMKPAMEIQKELMSIPDFSQEPLEDFAAEKDQLSRLKKAILMIAGSAFQELSDQLEKEQELLMYLADMLIDLYLTESTLLRVVQIPKDAEKAAVTTDILRTYLCDVTARCNQYGRNAINAFATGDNRQALLIGLKRFTKPASTLRNFNTVAARRNIALHLKEHKKYDL